jgi:hypothetical protein
MQEVHVLHITFPGQEPMKTQLFSSQKTKEVFLCPFDDSCSDKTQHNKEALLQHIKKVHKFDAQFLKKSINF